MRKLVLISILAFAFSNLSAQSDFTGRWVQRVDNNDGTFRVTVYALTQQGSAVSGSIITVNSETPIVDGSVNGNAIRFATETGPQTNRRRTEYRGTLSGAGELQLTATRTGAADQQISATRGPESAGRLPARIEPPPLHDVSDGGLAKTPPMGWNSWNHFHGRIDDATVREIADAMVSSGMKKAGYQYVNIDDTWELGRDANGNITTNRKFPDMKALADYVHSKGLKLGIYSGPGPYTCAGYEGSFGHEIQDAKTYAAWGIDYLKYDWCSAGRMYKDGEMQAVYQKMGDALRSSGRAIVFSLCQYGRNDVWTWGPKVGGNLWRTTGDISDNWASMSRIGFGQADLAPYAAPGHWNDPDMLEVGNGGMSDAEYRTHMSLWALLAAPLLAGNDLRSMTPEVVSILTNPDVIAVDQDKLGKQATRVKVARDLEVWERPLAGGAFAVGLFNRGTAAADINVACAEIKACGKYEIRDLWNHETLGRLGDTLTANLPGHGVALYKLTH